MSSTEVVVYQKHNGDEFTEKEKEEFDVGKDGTSISSDNKKITEKYSETEPISEFFKNKDGENLIVKLFENGEVLRIIDYKWWYDYKKVR